MASLKRYDLRRRAFGNEPSGWVGQPDLIGRVRLQREIPAIAVETITANEYVDRAKVSNIEDLDQAFAAVHGV